MQIGYWHNVDTVFDDAIEFVIEGITYDIVQIKRNDYDEYWLNYEEKGVKYMLFLGEGSDEKPLFEYFLHGFEEYGFSKDGEFKPDKYPKHLRKQLIDEWEDANPEFE